MSVLLVIKVSRGIRCEVPTSFIFEHYSWGRSGRDPH